MGTLLPTQKNKIYKAVANAGFLPAQVGLDITDYGFELNLGRIDGERLYISALTGNNMFAILYLGRTGHSYENDATNFDELVSGIQRLLTAAAEELETPDLWSDTEIYKGYVDAGPSGQRPNTRFSQAEQQTIAWELRRLASEISANNDLTAKQIELLDQKVEYLIVATDRLGRFDWVGLVTGWLFSYVFEAAVDPRAATEAVVKFSQTAYELAYPVLKQII